jgi:hypothetical protein
VPGQNLLNLLLETTRNNHNQQKSCPQRLAAFFVVCVFNKKDAK